MRAAAIDVGTNTVRLLVGEPDGAGGYRPIFAAQEITRLGQGLLPDRLLQPEPMQRTLAVLEWFRRLADSHGASRTAVVGTSALREASNRQEFLRRARRETGLDVRVISGEEEARLTLRGVRAALPAVGTHCGPVDQGHHLRSTGPDAMGAPLRGRLLLMDIGGGSTEFLLADGDAVVATASTGLGVVKLTEAHVRHDPPILAELTAIHDVVAARLARLRAEGFPGVGPAGAALATTFVGTAGTVTTLAAVDLSLTAYDPGRVNGHRLSRNRVHALLRELASLPLARRRTVPGLEPARADVIVAGALVCQVVMETLGFPSIVVSDGGLREGILLDLLG
jgi:exopolyphosphatase/guanosine-5'-triphosphate,3'-diphosphate pyrophosphatase